MNRFSSRRHRLDHAFLSKTLAGAISYRRIAGYFRSSIFELVGEEIAEASAGAELLKFRGVRDADRTVGADVSLVNWATQGPDIIPNTPRKEFRQALNAGLTAGPEPE